MSVGRAQLDGAPGPRVGRAAVSRGPVNVLYATMVMIVCRGIDVERQRNDVGDPVTVDGT